MLVYLVEQSIRDENYECVIQKTTADQMMELAIENAQTAVMFF